MTRYRGATRLGWRGSPTTCGETRLLLPPALPGHPPVLTARAGPATLGAQAERAALEVVRAHRLFWPTPRYDAIAAKVVVDLSGADAAEAEALLDAPLSQWATHEILVIASGRFARMAAARGRRTAPTLAHAAPEALVAVHGPAGAPAPFWAALGGARGGWLTQGGLVDIDPLPWFRRAQATDPWRGGKVAVADGLVALIVLNEAARRNARPRGTIGMSRWKRRNIAPFLAGPCGATRHFRTAGAAQRALGPDGTFVVWGAVSPTGAANVEKAEDGFIRSVGLGVRHTPPASLAIVEGGLHFDARGENGFVRLARAARFPPDLLARARLLRERVVCSRVTKYNLDARRSLPDPGGRLALLVPGQVEGDASLAYGSPAMTTNTALLEAARARRPDAFLLYKPHPDVATGLRPGAVAAGTLPLADAVAAEMSAEDCLDWADEVETMTSLMGFEALLRGKRVAVRGRPFYAGWGLTTELSGLPARGELSLDALVAAALILYPRYVDPKSGLPAPPEVVIEALAAERTRAGEPGHRLRALHRRLTSSLLNRFG